MLQSTFRLFNGIRSAGEQHLWDRGILRWDELLVDAKPVLGKRKIQSLTTQICEAKRALEAGLADYFISRLDGIHQVRLLQEFRSSTMYIDIETTGLEKSSEITTIAVYDGRTVSMYVNGLNIEDFLLKITSSGLIITYNGDRFDLPRLRERFGIDLSVPHIDLWPILYRLGHRGGLKTCEQRFGITRPDDIAMNGAEAVCLWKRYDNTGDICSLNMLLRYNALDAVLLERICGCLYSESMAGFPIDIPFNYPKTIPVYCGDELIFDNCITR